MGGSGEDGGEDQLTMDNGKWEMENGKWKVESELQLTTAKEGLRTSGAGSHIKAISRFIIIY